MIEFARGSYFFVLKGEIVHTPRRLGSEKQLPGWLGDESNGSLMKEQCNDNRVIATTGRALIVNTENMTPEELLKII
jgi:hypothetical protein